MSDALLKNTFNKISPAYELVADVTVATATTQVDFSGLNFGKDDDLLLVSDIINTSGSGSGYRLYANTNYTDANYWTQVLGSNSTAISGARYNEASFSYLINNAKAFNSTNIKLTNSGHFVYQSGDMREYGGSGVSMTNLYMKRSAHGIAKKIFLNDQELKEQQDSSI